MKMSYYSHTDLALEIQEELDRQGLADGYSTEVNHYYDGRIKESKIVIRTAQAARCFGKFPGTYITLEGVDLSENDGGFHEHMSLCIAKCLKELLKNTKKILVVGLGNRNITPDALGPFVIDHLLVTRPAFTGRLPAISPDRIRSTLISSAIAPGVMAQTGMETVEIIRGVIAQTEPEKIIVIDALAARSFERLNSTVQISSTGISPGSGVGNRRKELSEDTLGIPVIALGVPTVISIPSVAGDLIAGISKKLSDETRQELARILHFESDALYQSEDYYVKLASLIDKRLYEFTMTPKDADESVRRISFTISEGINKLITFALS